MTDSFKQLPAATNPRQDTLEPNRAKLRTDNPEAIYSASNVESLDPMLALHLKLKLDAT